jgi:hypothetical protein
VSALFSERLPEAVVAARNRDAARYARSGDIHVAYQVFGEGPDLIMAPGFVSQIENFWDEPSLARCELR